MDSNLQTINDDIAQILLKYLQNYWQGLLALSLTCKQWQAKVDIFVVKRLRYLAPKTQICSITHRNTTYEEFSLLEQMVSEIRIFEEYFSLPIDMVGLYYAPWESDIAFLMHDGLFLVLNTTDGSEIYREVGCTFHNLGFRAGTFISFNEHLRMVVVETVDPNEKVCVIRVFSLNNKQMALVHTRTNEYHQNIFPNVLLTNDGTIWINKRPVYSIKSPTLDMPLPALYVIAIKQNDSGSGNLVYYCTVQKEDKDLIDEETIRIYDTSTRQSWIYFSHPRLISGEIEGPPPEITFHSDCELIHVGGWDSALMQVVDGKLKFIMTAQNLFHIRMSPDRTKFFYAESEHLTIYSIASGTEEYIKTLPTPTLYDYDYGEHFKDEKLCTLIKKFNIVDAEGLDKKYSNKSPLYDFNWMDNETIFGVSQYGGLSKITKININTSDTDIRGIDMPLGLKFRRGIHSHSIIDERTAILHAATDTTSAVIKITL